MKKVTLVLFLFSSNTVHVRRQSPSLTLVSRALRQICDTAAVLTLCVSGLGLSFPYSFMLTYFVYLHQTA